MRNAIFVTGGTGFLGTEIISCLLGSVDGPIYVLVRAKDERAACHRLKSAWYHNKDLYGQIGSRIIPVTGDFTRPGLGLERSEALRLQEALSCIFHVGAETAFQKEEAHMTSVNRDGTANLLAFARGVRDLKAFVHISTAYVAGRRRGLILEEGPLGQTFSSPYEKTKAQAEALVRASGLPYVICRPGMIVGHTKTGRVRSFNTVYYILKMMLTGRLSVLPVDKNLGLNLVPVDYVAEAAVKIGLSKSALGRTFHLTCPKDMQPKVGELAEYVRVWANDHLGLNLSGWHYAPLPGLKKAGLAYNQKKAGKKKNFMTNLLTLIPYFYSEQEFDRTNTEEIMGPYDLEWRAYVDPLLEFACRKNFMEQTERTVFEQANVRRASRSFPVTYYDVQASGIKGIRGDKVNRRIQKILAALWAWGIRRGDKVALTGINCVDYMMLDQAIGLIGGVGVPIYYTTPVEEIGLLLEKSGAGWFFIGDRRIMSGLDRLETDARIVAFSDGLKYLTDQEGKQAEHETEKLTGSQAEKGILGRELILWKDFLKKGRKPAPVQAPDPEDLATIRYTSGTTGEPKGVMFNYWQLAWMGEVLTNLLSWQGRNKEMRYLSFLPESHVVEGILASYAPYYMLAKVDFYFLNDFGALVEALPKVRPTVFFSVPRFYEKLWDQLAAHPMGQKYLAMKEGRGKKALGRILKMVILKKAGLDACEQLIVGSAPMSQALLEQFSELGIEIHNAYGQTEAPLITINRMGDNVIPTIGTPLPETEVTLTEEDELLVRGPQVCLGYYGLETDTIQNGLLKTGDLGKIDDKGHITLFGRKKDMIITAYGKNISIPKIEERLKNIPEVSEAILIGENRPYCTALIWLEEAVQNKTGNHGKDTVVGQDQNRSRLEVQIEKINADLSHPEQIRRFRIIHEPLSIQRGELTPNLKVKRANVEAHYRKEIEEMYL